MARKPIPRPFSQLKPAEQLAEARSAISRLEATMNQGNNRFGSYGDNCRDSIKRWEATIARLTQA